ncbi:MAG: RIP metalloprotease RseP [Defluviitaleaceae bacterium]|nr:RIP metalloprotease RseP [Defluviitaleaceae bacterium]
MPIIFALLIFSVIVLIHELGHFFAARKCGILVEEFAIGMGPKVAAIKKGDTVFSVRMFPIGGFCAMLGDVGEDDERTFDPRAFQAKTLGQRFTVLIAGVMLNFLLAFIIFTGLTFFSGISEPVVTFVAENSPASSAGIQVGDRITRIDGNRINIYEDLVFQLNRTQGRPVDAVIQRDGQRIDTTFAPVAGDDGTYRIAIGLAHRTGLLQERITGFERAGIFESVWNGFWRISFYIRVTLYGLSQLITMNLSPDEISGPVGIVNTIGETYAVTAQHGMDVTIRTMLLFVAILSANLGVMNLLPLPALDGGRLIFIILEFIRRKPVPPEKEGMIHFAGFVMLMLLSAAIAYNDIVNVFFR